MVFPCCPMCGLCAKELSAQRLFDIKSHSYGSIGCTIEWPRGELDTTPREARRLGVRAHAGFPAGSLRCRRARGMEHLSTTHYDEQSKTRHAQRHAQLAETRHVHQLRAGCMHAEAFDKTRYNYDPCNWPSAKRIAWSARYRGRLRTPPSHARFRSDMRIASDVQSEYLRR